MTTPDLPWIKSYPPGIPWNAKIDMLPVHHLLDDAAARAPDRHAIEFQGKAYTYAQLHECVQRFAAGLQSLGVGPGIKVGLYLPNSPHYAIAFFAVLKAGGTVVNYSPLDAGAVLAHKIADSETDIIVTLDLESLYPLMNKLLGSTRLKTLVVGNMGEVSGAPDKVQAELRSQGQLCDVAWDAQRIAFASLLDNDGLCAPVAPIDLHDTIAVLQYTGGTTGLPKGAMLSHGNLSAGCSQAVQNLSGGTGLQDGRETFLAVLPLFHIYALTFNLLLGVRLAATLVLHARFDPAAAIRDLAEKRVTVFFGVPTMFTAINMFPGVEGNDFSSLKLSNSGGAPLPVEVHERYEALTGCKLQEGWGMTEICGVGTNTPMQRRHKIGSCGVPLPGITIRFISVDDPGKPVAYGRQGEICIAGPNVMTGYWKKPEATAEAMTPDGFLRTGDVGYMDDDGFMWIVDRIKDMILCSGYNVYPRNIEEAIYKHPSVAEVLVVGVPDAYRGEAPKAFITLKQGAPSFTLDELKGFLKDSLGKHEMVQALEFRVSLPKTAVGKLSRKELQDEEKRRVASSA
ncbi:long-chain-fatty-acid--CoA ligase [Noviherbaspirillum galbum]|uniref:long-chain-fatty-acid--CoA ligase n=1 Tax=Noviherbaspirillum galbum TaxID=2709383 RepID=UPI002E2D5D6A|nr:long-chain fatty acid--CoA ligase [Noviherbaspirillum galbum]